MCYGTDNKRFDPDRHPLKKDGGLDRRYKKEGGSMEGWTAVTKRTDEGNR